MNIKINSLYFYQYFLKVIYEYNFVVDFVIMVLQNKQKFEQITLNLKTFVILSSPNIVQTYLICKVI